MLNKLVNFIKNKMTIDQRKSLNYQNKVILAPMVRFGTLPMRLLALRMGADIVYTEELIDLKLLQCKRVINRVLDTVDFVNPADGTIVFRTNDEEKSKVVLQMGTCDAERALAVGKLLQDDIAALDINMGCPKEFSIKGGMGVALLAEPDKAVHILKTLVDNLQIPVTCKIRILPKLEETIKLVQRLASTGIAAIAIHARTRDERPQHEPHLDFIREIKKAVDIPIIANGGSKNIRCYEDITKFKDLSGADSVMIARAAQLNVSIFRKKGLMPMDDLIKKVLKLSVDFDNASSNTKYIIQNILKELQETPKGKQFLQSQTLQQMCALWDMSDYYRHKQEDLKNKGNLTNRRDVVTGLLDFIELNESPVIKRAKIDSNEEKDDIIEENVAFLRSYYGSKDTQYPKTVLYAYACRNEKTHPFYQTEQIDKLFRTVCTFDGRRYTSSFWEKNKKQAEQGAAIVCLLHLGLVERDQLIQNGILLR